MDSRHLVMQSLQCGTVVVQYVHGPQETYAVLFTLIFFHLATNFMAVRVISMCSFNRQRASIAWQAYRSSFDGELALRLETSSLTFGSVHGNAVSNPTILSHQAVSRREQIFVDSSWIVHDKTFPARCFLGVPFASIRGPCTGLEGTTTPLLSTPSRLRHDTLTDEETVALLEVFTDDKYVLWFASPPAATVRLVVGFKEGHGPQDHLKAWAHAHEVVRICGSKTPSESGTQLAAVQVALERVSKMFPSFVEAAKATGWKVDEGALVGGSPVTMSVELGEGVLEDRKNV